MNFLLIRHADAVPLGEAGVTEDEDRPLTEKGQAQCRPLARALHRMGVKLGMIISSPLLRAKQTAEGLLQHWEGEKPEVQIANALAPGRKRRKLAKLLLPLEAETVTLVGHMPDLATLTGWLMGDKKVQIDIAKAGAAYLVGDTGPTKGGAMLTWMVTPEWCEAVGGNP